MNFTIRQTIYVNISKYIADIAQLYVHCPNILESKKVLPVNSRMPIDLRFYRKFDGEMKM